MSQALQVAQGIAYFRPRGETTLAGAVEMVANAISVCREHRIAKLFVSVKGLTGVSIPTLVDRFLAAEEWAQRSQSMVTVALVCYEEYIHPEKFGVEVARDFGLVIDVCVSESDALRWLEQGESAV